MSAVRIREATRTDAGRLAGMMNGLNAHEGMDDKVFTEAKVLAQAFGSDPTYTVLLAEADGGIVGYATYHEAYDPDFAERGYWMVDLFVEKAARGRGVGHALVSELARRAVAQGRASICWGVMPSNRRAWSFYESLGAVEDPGRMMGLHGAALSKVAGSRAD